MSWLDKLLGRGKDAAQGAQEKAETAFDEVKERVSGDETAATEVTEREEGAARARDDELGTENRIPPGAS